jgi:hypothetical protein
VFDNLEIIEGGALSESQNNLDPWADARGRVAL